MSLIKLPKLKIDESSIKEKVPLNLSSTRNLSNNYPIEIFPTQVYFTKIQINNTYELSISVKNLTKVARRIRVFQPKTSKFRCHYDIKGPIAPGLQIKLQLSFSTQTLGDFQDEIRIISEDNFSQVIPIFALQSQAQILFEPFLNLGFVKKSTKKIENIYFKNEGTHPGKVELKCDQQKEITIEPLSFIVDPQQVFPIKVEFESEEAGIFRTTVDVKVEGFYNFQKKIEINATSVEFSRFFIDQNGNQIDQINFEKMFYGNKSKIKGFIVNNTPKKISFKQKIRIGPASQIKDSKNLNSLQTPRELGEEQTMNIISCSPSQGFIDSYSQIPITFICDSKITENILKQTLQNAVLNQINVKLNEEDFEYSSIMEIENDEPIIMNIIGRLITPDIKLSQSVFQFGECPVNEHRDIKFTIQNQSEQKINLKMNKNFYFSINPQVSTIESNQIQQFIATFSPKSAGQFNNEIILELLQNYKFTLKLFGTSSTFQKPRNIKKKGIESTDEDYLINQNLIEQGNYEVYQRKKCPSYNLVATSIEHQNTLNFSRTLQMYQSSENVDQFEQFMSNQKNKNKYDNFIKSQRVLRLKSEQNKLVKEKLNLILEQNQFLAKKQNQKSIKNLPVVQFYLIQDYDQLLIQSQRTLESPKLKNNEFKDQLFVTKQIDKYEPLKIAQQIEFKPDSQLKSKKKFPSQPQSHSELRDCSAELSGNSLQKIQAGPTIIKFGQIFIKSQLSQTFWIRNDLQNSIQVQLQVFNNELEQSYLQPQIIPQGQQAGFDILFQSQQIQNFVGNIKYIINGKYEFFINVSASVEQVKLTFNKQSIKCIFTEENMEMETSETLKVTNNGNSKAYFKWIKQSDQNLFLITPNEGHIDAQSSKNFTITYSPNHNSSGRVDEEKLILKIKDGQDMTLKVTGQVNEFKSEFTTQQLNLGLISVYKKVESTVWIQNQSKTAVFHVKELPPYTEITPSKAKILQDETKPFKITFLCKDETDINSELVFYPRGSQTIKLPFKVQTKIPNILVQEEIFDFGKLTTLGNPGYLPLTLINLSPMAAVLIMDLRDNQKFYGPECMDIELLQGNSSKQQNALLSIDPSQIQQDDIKIDKQQNNMDTVQKKPDQKNRYYKINIQGKSELKFRISFISKEIKTYSFDLPLQIYGVGVIPSIQRQVGVIGLKPRFILEPQNIEFKRKIITSIDKREPIIQTLVLSNPDTQKLKWQIDCTKFIEEKIFSITPNKGVLKSGEQIELKAIFNPYKSGIFEQFADLYIDDNFQKSQISIKLKGEGIFPRITFDRREIILPIVPLGITSKAIFQIFNEGYDNYSIKHSIPQELGTINLKINFIEGKNLSVTITKLRVEIQYTSLKPQSFSTKIDFFDETGRQYSIPVSGTSDNSILSIQNYINRCQDDFEIRNQDQQQIMISQIQKQDEVQSQDEISKNTQIKLPSIFQQIPLQLLQTACKTLMSWLNLYVLSQNIFSFPYDIVNNNGAQLYEIIYFFVGSNVKFQKKIDFNAVHDDDFNKYQYIIQQYEEIIYYLKEQGALLNNIRPFYLLKYQDFLNFQKNDIQKDNININLQIISESQYNYFLEEQWLTLTYQIIKIFQFCKFNEKQLKNYSLIYDEVQLIPDYYLEQSNLYSQQEIILLRWLELHGSKGLSIRISNLATDLKDGLILAQVIKSYVKSQIVEKILVLNERCQNEQDCRSNLTKVLQAIQEIGFQMHLKIEELLNPQPRDIILFISQLYIALPHYKPKNDIIYFECILGESVTKLIELNNSTNKPVSYYVRYEGSSDFIIEESSFKIEPKSIYKFKVQYILKDKIYQIWFTNRKDGNSQAAALVFDLESKITDRKSLEFWNVKSMLYQQEEIKMQINNIFIKSLNEFSEFQVTLVQYQKNKKKNKKDHSQQEEQMQQAFFLQKKTLKIRKGESTSFSVFFIPLEKETHYCKVIFCDQSSGEFQHEIIGEVLYPGKFMKIKEIIQEIKPQQSIMVDEKFNYDISFSIKNEQRIQAQKLIDQKLNNKFNQKQLINDIQYNVQMNPPISYIHFQENFELKNIELNKNEFQTFPLQFLFTKPVMNLQTQLIFESIDKKDVRVYKIILNIHPKIIKAKIEMVSSLQEQLVQEIPLINYSDKNWVIRVNFTQENQKFQFFSGPKEFYVKGKSTGYYNLTYLPTYFIQTKSKLIFTNPATNDIFEYELEGNVTDPLAQDHFIIKCNVRQQIKKVIQVKNNYNKPITYLVETDLQWAWGQTCFDIGPLQTYNYTLNLNPLFGGIFAGQISFQEKEDPNKFIWYTFCLNVEKPKCQKQLEISCVIRKAVAFEITLNNPLKESITYEINIEGDSLMGDQYFQLDAGKSGNYELIYSPHQLGTFKGAVSILNEKLGEIWYELKLVCEPSDLQKLPNLSSELGKFSSRNIIIENNSELLADVKPILTNNMNFSIFPGKIQIQPFNQTTIQLRYTPTSLEQLEQCDILLQSEQIGDWKYKVGGKGQLPKPFDPINVRSQIGSSVQFQISFKNPINQNLNIYFELTKQSDSKCFKLMTQQMLTLTNLQDLQIPIEFKPLAMQPYECILLIKSDKVTWEYPIHGTVDNFNLDQSYHFKTKTRLLFKTQTKISLPGQLPDKNSYYTLTVDKIPEEYQVLIKQALQIQDLKNQIKLPDDQLIFNIKFLPMKQIKINCQFLISKNTGGSWRFNLTLESTEPDVDDTIEIFSPIGYTSTVQFKLPNNHSYQSNFIAFFTKESDPQFQIYPKSGILPSEMQPQMIFYVQFTPTEYGKEKIGKIIIETEDMYWSFNVVGSFPKYIPPQIEGSIIDNWNTKMKQKHDIKINYLADNINFVKNQKDRLKSIKE